MKHARFTLLWNKLEHNSEFYWQLLRDLPDQTLKQQPTQGKWSMLQIMEHLAGAEEIGLLYLKRKNYTPLQTKSLLPSGVRAFILHAALRSPLKFKAPQALEQYPTNTTDPQVLLQRWLKLRQSLKSYLEQVPKDKEDKMLFRHPTIGPLTLEQTLQFMSDHLIHHQKQVKLLLEQTVTNS